MYNIRKFKPSDLDQVLQLFYDTVHAINSKDYSPEQINAWAPEKLDRDRWLSKLLNHITYVAVLNDDIVGFADATEQGEIDNMYIHKDYQGRGIATELLKILEKELQKQGISEFSTYASITARPFFEKRGYKLIEEQDMKHRSGLIFRNYLMKKNAK